MMNLFSLLSEGVVLPIALRAFCLVTVLIVCAWILSVIAGVNNAVLRSHIWTTAMSLVLVVPLFSTLCEHHHWVIVNLSKNWLGTTDAISREMTRANEIHDDRSPGFTPDEFEEADAEKARRMDSMSDTSLSRVATSAENIVASAGLKGLDQRANAKHNFRTAASLFIAIWAIGIAIGMFRLGIAILRLNRLFHSVNAVNPSRLACISSEACRTLGLASLPKIAASPEATTAAAMCRGFRGIIILPSRMVTELSDSELKDVVTHECAHLIRWDPFIGLLQSVAVALFWPNPLIYWARRELTRSREEVCDNYALKGTDAIHYSKTLLRIAEQGVMGRSLHGVAGLSSNFWRLEDRIKGILDEDRSTRVSLGRCTYICVVTLLGLIAVLGGFSRFGAAEQEKISRNENASLESFHGAWHPQGVMVLGEERGRKWGPADCGFDLSPDGQQIATGSYDGRISLWNATTMTLEHLISGHDGRIVDVHYSPDGSSLISIGADKRILSWDLTTRGDFKSSIIRVLDSNPEKPVWSVDGSTLFIDEDLWALSNEGNMRRIAKIPDWKEANRGIPDDIKALAKSVNYEYTVSTGGSVALALSSDGDQLATSSGGNMIWIHAATESVTKFVDSTITIWGLTDNEFRKRFEIDGVGFVCSLAFSPDGHTLAIGGHDNKTRLFDLGNGQPQKLNVIDHNEPAHGLCFDPKGETLIVAAGGVQLWDLKTKRFLDGRSAPFDPNLQHLTKPIKFVFSSDNRTVFYCDGICIRRWIFTGPYPEIDDEKDLSAIRPGRLAATFQGKQLFSMLKRNDSSEISVRDFSSLDAKPKPWVTKIDGYVDNLSFSKDEKQFVFSNNFHPRYTLQLWQQTPEGPTMLDSADLKNSHPGSFWCTAFSPDGKTLATGHRDGAIRLWDVSNGRLHLSATEPNVHRGGVGGLDYSPNGNLLASVDWGGVVTLWNITGDGIEMKVELGEHSERAYHVRFSPDGRTLATADYSGAIKLWTIGEESRDSIDLVSHTGGVSSLEFEPKGKNLLSSGYDGRVIVWDLEKVKPIREWRFPGPVHDSQFDPTGQKIVSSNGNGSLYAWEY